MSYKDVKGFISSLSIRRPAASRAQNQPVQEVRPSGHDLALQTLRRKYREYLAAEDPSEKEAKLFQLVPLFNKSCSRTQESELVEKFPEVYDFAENVAFIFVRHVTQLAQVSPSALFEYFEVDSNNLSAGISLLKGIPPPICVILDAPINVIKILRILA